MSKCFENRRLILGGNSTSVTNGNKTTLNYGFADYWILKLGPDALSMPPRLRTAPQSSSQIRTTGFRFYLQGLCNVAYVVDYRQASPTWVPLVTNTRPGGLSLSAATVNESKLGKTSPN